MSKIFRYLLFVWCLFFAMYSGAQTPGADARIRTHTTDAKAIFMKGGAVELQRNIEFCHAKASGAFNSSKVLDEIEMSLLIEQCVSYDQLGVILFIAHRRMMLERFNKSFDDPFFIPETHNNRTMEFLNSKKLESKKFSDFVFAVVLEEFNKSTAVPTQNAASPKPK